MYHLLNTIRLTSKIPFAIFERPVIIKHSFILIDTVKDKYKLSYSVHFHNFDQEDINNIKKYLPLSKSYYHLEIDTKIKTLDQKGKENQFFNYYSKIFNVTDAFNNEYFDNTLECYYIGDKYLNIYAGEGVNDRKKIKLENIYEDPYKMK